MIRLLVGDPPQDADERTFLVRTPLKRLLVCGYCRGLLPVVLVDVLFRALRLRGA